MNELKGQPDKHVQEVDNFLSPQTPVITSIHHGSEIGLIAQAMALVQGELKVAIKDARNPFFKSSYADLGSVWISCREALTKHKVAVIQVTGRDEHGLYLETILAHSSGQWFKGRFPINPVKNDPQALGSATSYARRYALSAIVGVTSGDDDGEAAMPRPARLDTPAKNIVPDQPVMGDGFIPPDYRIDYGGFKGKAFTEIPLKDLREYVDKVELGLTGGKIPQNSLVRAKEFVYEAAKHIASLENSK